MFKSVFRCKSMLNKFSALTKVLYLLNSSDLFFFLIWSSQAWRKRQNAESSRSKSGRLMKTGAARLKSADFKSFMRSAKPNLITQTSFPIALTPSSFSFFIGSVTQAWNIHAWFWKINAAAKRSWSWREGSWLFCTAILRPMWQRASSQAAAPVLQCARCEQILCNLKTHVYACVCLHVTTWGRLCV